MVLSTTSQCQLVLEKDLFCKGAVESGRCLHVQVDLCAMDQYFVKLVYEKLRGDYTGVIWDTVVWNRLSIPKHGLISSLAVQNKLQTTSKLAQFGMSANDTCLICGSHSETHQHLFLKCQFSLRYLRMIKD